MLIRFCLALFLGLIGSTGAMAAEAAEGASASPPLGGEGSDIGNTADMQRYSIRVLGENTRLTLSVNGVPIFFKILHSNDKVELSYNEWLQRGLNQIDIQAERFSTSQPYSLKYEIFYQSPIQIVEGSQTNLFTSPADVSLPLRQSYGLRTPSMPELRVWLSERVVMNDAEKQKIVDSINRLRSQLQDALVKGNNAILATFDKSMRDQYDRAYGRPLQTDKDILVQRKAIVEKLAKLVNASVEMSPEAKIEDLTFDIVASGRLIRISRKDGTPVLSGVRGDIAYSYPRPFFGNVAGLWEMLR